MDGKASDHSWNIISKRESRQEACVMVPRVVDLRSYVCGSSRRIELKVLMYALVNGMYRVSIRV